ncbi:cyclodeaminase/cyclohydrolase family protein [Clostridium estertheticum]|uniref:cyclodeaminase/cyclohydrolase family protein n=1 Tax=Clostridium estertheticum TaxID=238834 RepID=UPI001C7DF853|nr:cyclodeaminase/cyclohydrolase family protein [Clostridium estertheticum]MBX4263049.1 cyclodeaminase/cyclohydrolase family protein [Clostridium estertheticum]WLC89370.1 cyclodeaminase/cyclohydrolase family protein [Clostridium estertheticum]
MLLVDKSVREFIDQTSQNCPVPGGGSIAALSGASAAALVSMVASLTIGKKGYEDSEVTMKEVYEQANKYKEKFIEYIDADSESFHGVMDAFKLPKNNDEEKATRKEIIQNALKHASETPYQIAENAYRLMEYSEIAVEHGNKNAVTDAAVSAMMARSAVLSALYNVKINLASINDSEFVAMFEKKVSSLETNVVEREKRILSKVVI